MIPKGFENIHLKETSPVRKVANIKSKSTNEVAQKSRKIGYPTGLKTQPLFPLG